MNILLDTHILLWILLGSRRLRRYRWLERYLPWGISPVSLMEVQFLAEIGRIEVRNPEFSELLMADRRFIVDEVPLLSLVTHTYALGWTRDPFDRLLAAHSAARRLPFCSADETILAHHRLIPRECRMASD